jgi:hypothetical protein
LTWIVVLMEATALDVPKVAVVGLSALAQALAASLIEYAARRALPFVLFPPPELAAASKWVAAFEYATMMAGSACAARSLVVAAFDHTTMMVGSALAVRRPVVEAVVEYWMTVVAPMSLC